MYSILTSLFQDNGFKVVLLESSFTKQGPASFRTEEIVLKPGPPPM